MTNRESAYSRAFEVKKNNLKRKEAEYDAKIAKLSAENPRYNQISSQLSALGARVALTALSGDTNALSELSERINLLQAERDEIVKNAGIKPFCHDCQLCRDTGYVSGKICDCVKQIAKGFAVGMLSDSLPLNTCRFEDFDLNFYPEQTEDGPSKKRMTSIFKLCKEYVLNFDPQKSESLLFIGDTGLGKTHLSLSIVGELLKKDYDVLYGSAYNLFSKIEKEHFSEHVDDTYNYAINCDWLVIDDLGSEFTSPFIQSILYNIINTRLLASKPVIISTNLGLEDIENKYTARVASRILGHYVLKEFLGNDIRQIKSMAK